MFSFQPAKQDVWYLNKSDYLSLNKTNDYFRVLGFLLESPYKTGQLDQFLCFN